MPLNRHMELREKVLKKLVELDQSVSGHLYLGFGLKEAKEALTLIQDYAADMFYGAYKKDPDGRPIYAALMKCPRCDGDTELAGESQETLPLPSGKGTTLFHSIERTRKCGRCETVFKTTEATHDWFEETVSSVVNTIKENFNREAQLKYNDNEGELIDWLMGKGVISDEDDDEEYDY